MELFDSVRAMATYVESAVPGPQSREKAERELPAVRADQGLVTGPVPLLPEQHRFFERRHPEPHHENVGAMFQVPPALNPDRLARAVQALLSHHDALRLRFVRTSSGWQQFNAGMGEPVPCTRVDLSQVPPSQEGEAIEAAAAAMQASLNLSEGPLLRVVLFDLGASRPGRLLITVHHLAADGLSMELLVRDLQVAYQQLERGDTVSLPAKTTAFKHWAERLDEYAQSEAQQQEIDFWLGLPWSRLRCFPLDYPRGISTTDSDVWVEIPLGRENTRALLAFSKATRTKLHEILLAALAQTLARWTGTSAAAINLIRHGRQALFKDVDLSRSAGFFISLVPVVLDLEGIAKPEEVLIAVREQFRRIPRGGIGYGLLRYLSRDPEIVEKFRALPRAEINFNYQVQFDQIAREQPVGTARLATGWQPARESGGPFASPRADNSHTLGFRAWSQEGQISLGFRYSSNLHHPSTIGDLVENYLEVLGQLIGHMSGVAGLELQDRED